ncbi:MAG TPA: RNA polymerase sigma factor [Gemmatimonadales bacterium]|jgi:RNA polymerase sigma-70 factor (ECF subfamily)
MSTANLSASPDQDLVARFLDGDEAAYAELDRRYRGTVFRKILGIVRHRERAEDLTQETFRKMAQHLDGYSAAREFEPWLTTIAKNTARDYVQRAVFRSNARGARSLERVENRAADDPYASDTPRPDTAEFAQALDVALSQLRPHHRRAFILREMEGRDYDDIADLMGVSAGTVGSYLTRARQNLKRKLQPFLDPLPKDRQ